MNCPSCDKHTHREIAKRLAADIVCASRLGKTARSGRRLAYSIKGQKLSTGLIKFPEYFKILGAERDPVFDLLLSVQIPFERDDRPTRIERVHIPIASLTLECQAYVQATVVAILRESPYPKAA